MTRNVKNHGFIVALDKKNKNKLDVSFESYETASGWGMTLQPPQDPQRHEAWA